MISDVRYPTINQLDTASLLSVSGGSQQVMIYGFGHCGYGALCHMLSQPGSPIKKMLDCSVGNNQQPFYTIEGRRIYQINPDFPLTDTPEDNVKLCECMCKAGITNLVIENCKRVNEGLPLIPVIFAIDSDQFPLNPANVATRSNPLNSLLTHKELRRAYKLCNEVDMDFIASVSRMTFKFIKLTEIKPREYACVQTTPFWERAGWTQAWEARGKHLEQKRNSWKDQLLAGVRSQV